LVALATRPSIGLTSLERTAATEGVGLVVLVLVLEAEVTSSSRCRDGEGTRSPLTSCTTLGEARPEILRPWSCPGTPVDGVVTGARAGAGGVQRRSPLHCGAVVETERASDLALDAILHLM